MRPSVGVDHVNVRDLRCDLRLPGAQQQVIRIVGAGGIGIDGLIGRNSAQEKGKVRAVGLVRGVREAQVVDKAQQVEFVTGGGLAPLTVTVTAQGQDAAVLREKVALLVPKLLAVIETVAAFGTAAIPMTPAIAAARHFRCVRVILSSATTLPPSPEYWTGRRKPPAARFAS